MSQFGRSNKPKRLAGPRPAEEESPLASQSLPTTPEDHGLPSATLESLPPEIAQAAASAKWKKLMDVQARAIPYFLERQDLMVQSRTGSGKTGAFILPLLKRLDASKPGCQALVLTPTRELAQQVHQEAEMLFKGSGLTSLAVYGGVGYGAQLQGFKDGAQLVVGTPGRILDHLQRGTLSLEKIRVLILDEADRMLSMGFYPDMERIKRELPPGRINTYLFSATFPPRVMGLARVFLHEPEVLSLSRDHVHVTDIDHRYCVVKGLDKDRALIRLIEMENPDQALIFCNTKAQVEYLAETLKNFGYKAEGITSDLTQKKRERLIRQMKNGQMRLLVATDVASRGIDIPALSHVFLYEVPEDHEDYIHRAGRTGRAGAAGTAITLTGLIEQLTLRRVAKRYHIEMQKMEVPGEADVQRVVSERMGVILEARQHGLDALSKERIERFTELSRQLSQDAEGQKLLAMVLDAFYVNAKAQELAEVSDEEAEQNARDDAEARQGGGQRDRGRRRSGGDRRRSGGDRDRRAPRESREPREPRAEGGSSSEGAKKRRRRPRGGKKPGAAPQE